ncbi:MAG: cache domain-containing protein [Pseudomonadota bacterium]|nr:cache domain-containing protein [Pseudomonadota bacterium]
MNLRAKLLLVALLPLVASLALTAWSLHRLQLELAHQQQQVVRKAYTESAQRELKHYVALAMSAVAPYYDSGQDDAATKAKAMHALSLLDYGADGYFFLYDFDGTNLMHPRQPELVGKNLLWDLDEHGVLAHKLMIDKARSGGGFVDYTWNKPSTQQLAPKLSYVVGLPRWHWMIGTGLYTDDLDHVIAQLDGRLASTVNSTMRWIALAAVAAVGIVLFGILAVSLAELRGADAKLTLLTRNLVRTQEDERAWLSRELHDSTSQKLVAAKLLTEAALERLAPDEPSARPMLQRALARMDETLGDIRGFSHRLRPTTLDTLGLGTALRQLGDEMCGAVGTGFELQTENVPADLPAEIRTTLFRVSQEALTNVCKHAAASRVRMKLEAVAEGLRLTIADDGQGFDSAAMTEHPRRGIGLRNMRERLLAIGGHLRLSSRPRHTQVVAEVPAEAIHRFAKPV